jgi:hypothetical protein
MSAALSKTQSRRAAALSSLSLTLGFFRVASRGLALSHAFHFFYFSSRDIYAKSR